MILSGLGSDNIESLYGTALLVSRPYTERISMSLTETRISVVMHDSMAARGTEPSINRFLSSNRTYEPFTADAHRQCTSTPSTHPEKPARSVEVTSAFRQPSCHPHQPGVRLASASRPPRHPSP